MTVADYLEVNSDRLIKRWKQSAIERTSLVPQDSQLVDHLPELVEEIVEVLRVPAEGWPATLDAAENHGRERVGMSTDIGELVIEILLVAETLIWLAQQDGHGLTLEEVGRVIRALGRAASISARAYGDLRDAQVAAQAADHFCFLAHELRTPILVARLALNTLGHESESVDRESLGGLERALLDLSDLVDNSLCDARMTGRPQLQIERVSAGDLVSRAMSAAVAFAESRGIEVEADVANLELDVDPKLIVSALTNLLTNAVKFTEPGLPVTIRGWSEDGQAFFEVEDACGGMPPHLLGRLYEPFVQGGSDRSGFGLGLKIVKQAVEAHNGAVEVNNRPGRGCSFVLELPQRR